MRHMKGHMTKKHIRQIERAITELDRGITFLLEDNTKIVRRTGMAAMPEDSWTSGDNQRGVAITKEIGSDLCGVFSARETLARLLLQATQPAHHSQTPNT